jgi:plastocyanin
MVSIMKKINSAQKSLMVMTILLFSLSILTTSCKKMSDVPGTNEVFIQGMAFTPSTITITSGTTITWTNKDAATHNVTSNTAGLFSSGPISTNGTFPQLFSTAGTFQYKCTIHPSMTGTVIVN